MTNIPQTCTAEHKRKCVIIIMMILVKQKYSSDRWVSCLPQKEARRRCSPLFMTISVVFSLTSFCDYVLKSAHIPAHTCTAETNQSCLLHWNMYGGNIRQVESCCTFFRLLMWFLWGSVVLWYFCIFQVKVLLSDERLRDSSGYQGSRVEAMFYLNSAFEWLLLRETIAGTDRVSGLVESGIC